MRIDESHLVAETASDAGNHIVNVRTDGSDASELLTVGKPKVDLNSLGLFASLFVFVLDDTAIHANVLKVALKSTARSSDLDDTSVALDIDYKLNAKEMHV